MENIDKINHYMSMSQNYLDNAHEMINKKEYHKAGELLWGALAALIKSIGVIYNIPTRNHRELIKTAKKISMEMGDNELRESIDIYAQGLHANYYENFIDSEDFPKYYSEILSAYEKLFAIIIQEQGYRK